MSVKIYTKTGDGGKTGLLGGRKVLKSNIRIEAYGSVDELNAFIGWFTDQYEDVQARAVLLQVQHHLFVIGSLLAADPEKKPGIKIPALQESDIILLESEIDRMDEVLTPLKSFILPGGHSLVSAAHICRAVCRRAERSVVNLYETEPGEPIIVKYLNRLSDYLFTLARFAARELKVEEKAWKPK